MCVWIGGVPVLDRLLVTEGRSTQAPDGEVLAQPCVTT